MLKLNGFISGADNYYLRPIFNTKELIQVKKNNISLDLENGVPVDIRTKMFPINETAFDLIKQNLPLIIVGALISIILTK